MEPLPQTMGTNSGVSGSGPVRGRVTGAPAPLVIVGFFRPVVPPSNSTEGLQISTVKLCILTGRNAKTFFIAPAFFQFVSFCHNQKPAHGKKPQGHEQFWSHFKTP